MVSWKGSSTYGRAGEASLSDLASLRGRVQHYSACLPYILPFVVLLSSVTGSEANPDYDRAITLPPIVSEAAVFIRDVLEESGPSFPARCTPLFSLARLVRPTLLSSLGP